MTDETRILRTAGIPLVIGLIFLFVMPKMCSKALLVSKQRPEQATRIADGLHIESSQKPVTFPSGLNAERVRYLVEIDTAFAASHMARLPKTPPAVLLPGEANLLTALQKLGYVEAGPDGTLAISRDGLLHLDGLVDDGTSWSFPVAVREFRSITSIATVDGTTRAGFTWQWKPNAAGAALLQSTRRHEATAELTNGTGRWTLVQIIGVDDELE